MSSQTVYFTNPAAISTLQQQVAAIIASLPSSPAVIPSISFLLNGKQVIISNPDPEMTLVTYLRQYTSFTATKQGCQQGGCGICTVMLSYKDFDNTLRNVNVNSCLLKLVNVDGLAITTNEALGNTEHPHVIQSTFSKVGGFQCGYCTSGHIMSIYSAFQTQNGQSNFGMVPSFSQSEKNIDGNLCRCTVSRPIVEAYKTLMVTDADGTSSQYINPANPEQLAEYRALWTRWHASQGDNLAIRQIPVYVPTADTKNAVNYEAIAPISRPTTVKTFVSPKLEYTQVNATSTNDITQAILNAGGVSHIQIVNGETSFGVPGYSKESTKTTLINVQNIADLYTLTQSSNSITFGAGIKIAQLWEALSGSSNTNFQEMAKHINKISGHQVRNLGSWIGGVMMAKYGGFYSDMALVMQAAGALLNFTVFTSTSSTSYTGVDVETFLKTTYNGLILVTSATVSFTSSQIYRSYRQAKRSYNAHAEAHMGIRISMSGSTISSAYVVVGALGEGMTNQYSSYVRFTALETYLVGKTFASITNTSVVFSLVDSTLIDFVPPIVNYQYSLASQQSYKRGLIKGFLTQYLADMKGSTTYDLVTDKQTSFGETSWGNSTGSYEAFLNNPYDFSNIAHYQPLELSKATGQTVYNSDKINSSQLSIALIYSTQEAPWFLHSFEQEDYQSWSGKGGIPVQKVDYSSAQTIAALEAAKEMPGVKLVMSRLDIQPSLTQRNWSGAGMWILGFVQSIVYGGGATPNQLKGYSCPTWYVQDALTFPEYVLYSGQTLGFVVAENTVLAKAAAQYVSDNISYYIPPANLQVSPKVFMELTADNNIYYDKSCLSLTNFTYVGSHSNVPSTPSADMVSMYESNGKNWIGNFSTGYANSTYQSSGAVQIGAWDHFAMNRTTGLTQKQGYDVVKIISDAQDSAGIFDSMNMMYTWGDVLNPEDGVYYYGQSGAVATFADGTVVFDSNKWRTECGPVGGNFGQKFGIHAGQHAMLLARQILNQDVHFESEWIHDLSCNGGNGSSYFKYQLGFNDQGKITACYVDSAVDGGASPVDFNPSAGAFGSNNNIAFLQNYNLGAAAFNGNNVFTNKAPTSNARGIHDPDGTHSILQVLQHVSFGLQTVHGSTGASQFDVMLTNAITNDADCPFKAFTGPSVGAIGTPVNNLGELMVNPYTNAVGQNNGIGVYAKEWGTGTTEFVNYELLQTVDSKINQLYFTTGAISYFYPNGYTGSALPAPSNGSGYNDSRARFPAIKALEDLVNAHNALPANRFKKIGLATHISGYSQTTGYSYNKNVILRPDSDGNMMIGGNFFECGNGIAEKLIDTVANNLRLEPSTISANQDESLARQDQNINSGGSMISNRYVTAAIDASNNFLNNALDAIWEDLSDPYSSQWNNFNANGLVNVFAPTGSYNMFHFTGAPLATGVFGPYANVASINDSAVTLGQLAQVDTTDNSWFTSYYQKVGDGISSTGGVTGPSTNPEGYSNIKYGIQAIRYNPAGGLDSYDSSSAPNPDDLTWAKSNKDLARLTIVRYGHQNHPTGQAPISWNEWIAMSQEQQTAEMMKVWKQVVRGLVSGAPYFDVTFSKAFYLPNVSNCNFSTGGLRQMFAMGKAWASEIDPFQPYNPGFEILNGFYKARGITATLTMTELNILTGQWVELHVVTAHSCGRSVNPLSDAAQVEGGYLHGRSAYTTEDKLWNTDTGKNQNEATWDYKPNCSGEAPVRMDAIIYNDPNSWNNNLPNSYTLTGEAGMCASASAPAAIRDAIFRYRLQEGITTSVADVDSFLHATQLPLTNDRIKNACPLPSSISF